MLGSNRLGLGFMRVYCCAVTVALFASLALAQTNPAARPDVPSDLAQHQRHEADEEPMPAAASVLPDSPVITIEGVCDHASGAAASIGGARGQESPAAKLGKKRIGQLRCWFNRF